ncbi:unnamed protein product [Penicillium bialowiezense]
MSVNEIPGQQAEQAGTNNDNGLLSLPNEILQNIAIQLPTDKDLVRLALTCKALNERAVAPESAVWRSRFEEVYDVFPGLRYGEFYNGYLTRAYAFKRVIDFKIPENDPQIQWMKSLRLMVDDSLILQSDLDVPKTVKAIRGILKRGNFIWEPVKPGKSCEMFYALQLCLTALALDPSITGPCRRTDYDMERIYSIRKGTLRGRPITNEPEYLATVDFLQRPLTYEEMIRMLNESGGIHFDDDFSVFHDGLVAALTPTQLIEFANQIGHPPRVMLRPKPFIEHEKLNLALLLQFRSFWQRHFLSVSEQTFHESFEALPDELKPKFIKEDLSKASLLSSAWLGYYSCIHPIPTRYSELEHRQTCGSHSDEVEAMTLELKPQPNLFWPEECNYAVPLAKEVQDRFAFEGKQGIHGQSEDENFVFGFTEDIAFAYGELRGWKRICFAICERIGNEPAELGPDTIGWVHVYEAVIVPSGRTMLGRWMDLKHPEANGPFIFWDV